MNTPRILPAVVVAGLAVVAALATANFIQAADDAAKFPGPAVFSTGPAMAPATLRPGLSFAPGGPDFASSLPVFGRKLDWAYPARSPVIFIDHPLVRSFDPTPPGAASEAKPVDATAEAAARNEAEVNELFAVAPRINPARTEAAKNAQGERGKQVYLNLCYACHQPDGRGLPGAFPMLAKSDFLAADRTRAIRIVLEGLVGPVTVNGQTLNSAMPAQKTVLTDQQIADVLTYVFNAWENPGGAFKAGQVEAVRSEKRQD